MTSSYPTQERPSAGIFRRKNGGPHAGAPTTHKFEDNKVEHVGETSLLLFFIAFQTYIHPPVENMKQVLSISSLAFRFRQPCMS